MGGGSWTSSDHMSYCASRGVSYDSSTHKAAFSSVNQAYNERKLNEALDPKSVIRECVDSEEHPKTFPVILALDVTGSMGDAALAVAKELGVLMKDLYEKVKDIEFCVMGIGDLAYDGAPIQMSQFESDIRIAENLDKIYFEMGGGGNDYESYTAAWYMALHHTKLDAIEKRGQKGLIITLGDETLNPYLPKTGLQRVSGDNLQDAVETVPLYEKVKEKFHIFHINVDHGGGCDTGECISSFAKVIGRENVRSCRVDNVVNTITQIITDLAEQNAKTEEASSVKVDENGEISW